MPATARKSLLPLPILMLLTGCPGSGNSPASYRTVEDPPGPASAEELDAALNYQGIVTDRLTYRSPGPHQLELSVEYATDGKKQPAPKRRGPTIGISKTGPVSLVFVRHLDLGQLKIWVTCEGLSTTLVDVPYPEGQVISYGALGDRTLSKGKRVPVYLFTSSSGGLFTSSSGLSGDELLTQNEFGIVIYGEIKDPAKPR